MPLANKIFLRTTGWSTLADSTSVEYQYSISSFVVDVSKTSVIQVAQSSGVVVVVNGYVFREGVEGSSREITLSSVCLDGLSRKS